MSSFGGYVDQNIQVQEGRYGRYFQDRTAELRSYENLVLREHTLENVSNTACMLLRFPLYPHLLFSSQTLLVSKGPLLFPNLHPSILLLSSLWMNYTCSVTLLSWYLNLFHRDTARRTNFLITNLLIHWSCQTTLLLLSLRVLLPVSTYFLLRPSKEAGFKWI